LVYNVGTMMTEKMKIQNALITPPIGGDLGSAYMNRRVHHPRHGGQL
jgi:hypothetical protein